MGNTETSIYDPITKQNIKIPKYQQTTYPYMVRALAPKIPYTIKLDYLPNTMEYKTLQNRPFWCPKSVILAPWDTRGAWDGPKPPLGHPYPLKRAHFGGHFGSQNRSTLSRNRLQVQDGSKLRLKKPHLELSYTLGLWIDFCSLVDRFVIDVWSICVRFPIEFGMAFGWPWVCLPLPLSPSSVFVFVSLFVPLPFFLCKH